MPWLRLSQARRGFWVCYYFKVEPTLIITLCRFIISFFPSFMVSCLAPGYPEDMTRTLQPTCLVTYRYPLFYFTYLHTRNGAGLLGVWQVFDGWWARMVVEASPSAQKENKSHETLAVCNSLAFGYRASWGLGNLPNMVHHYYFACGWKWLVCDGTGCCI